MSNTTTSAFRGIASSVQEHINPWKNEVITYLEVCGILKDEHLNNPKGALYDLINHQTEVVEFYIRDQKWDRRLQRFLYNVWFRTPFPYLRWKK